VAQHAAAADHEDVAQRHRLAIDADRQGRDGVRPELSQAIGRDAVHVDGLKAGDAQGERDDLAHAPTAPIT
jgi:hypothetical protein